MLTHRSISRHRSWSFLSTFARHIAEEWYRSKYLVYTLLCNCVITVAESHWKYRAALSHSRLTPLHVSVPPLLSVVAHEPSRPHAQPSSSHKNTTAAQALYVSARFSCNSTYLLVLSPVWFPRGTRLMVIIVNDYQKKKNEDSTSHAPSNCLI